MTELKPPMMRLDYNTNGMPPEIKDRVDALGGFWIKARELAPKLDLAGRAELFSFLWGRHAPFTVLYKELALAVTTLGRPDEAFCPIAALIPREGSILEITNVVDFLASDSASFLNGIDITVDGGHRARWRGQGVISR